MESICRGIGIDNGGSSVRYAGYPAVGTYEKADQPFVILPNNFIQITEQPFRIKEGVNELEIMRVVESNNSNFKGVLAVGDSALAYGGERIVVTSLTAKTKCAAYYTQILMAIAQDGIKAVNARLADYRKKYNNSNVEPAIDYAIVTCIPAREHSGANNCAEELKANLRGTFRVEFPAMKDKHNAVSFTITPEYMEVAPEGGIAITLLPRQSLIAKEITAIGDIGHNTQDYSFFVGAKMIAGHVHTSNDAGKVLLTTLKDALSDAGYRVSDNKIEEVLVTSKVSRGTQNVDVSEIVRTVKRQYIKNKVLPEISTAIQKSGYVPEEIDNFVPVGAILSDATLAAELMAMAQITNAKLFTADCDARMLNVKCAYNRVKTLVAKMESDKAARWLP